MDVVRMKGTDKVKPAGATLKKSYFNLLFLSWLLDFIFYAESMSKIVICFVSCIDLIRSIIREIFLSCLLI